LAIGVNPEKKTMFTVEERFQFLHHITELYPNVTLDTFDNAYLVDYAKFVGAKYLIRGLRNSADFEYEMTMSQVNKEINSDVQSVFFMADRQYADISSSTVKKLIGPPGWQTVVRRFIPDVMYEDFVVKTSIKLS
jgi:pantetheine-phosphate adenylyltransferase